MSTATRTRRPVRSVLTANGLSAPMSCDVKAGHGYYMGASSSPSFVLVLAATDDVVAHVDSYSLSVSRTQRWIFEDLVMRGLKSITDAYNRAGAEAVRADTKTAMGRLAVQLAKVAEARWEQHSAAVNLADYDRVRFAVTRDGDAYCADQFGVLVDFDSDKNIATIETARSMAAEFERAGFRVLSTETIKACPLAA